MLNIKDAYNSYGDKLGKAEVCQGVLLFLLIGGLIACACMRGCQETKKKANKISNNKVVQIQNQR